MGACEKSRAMVAMGVGSSLEIYGGFVGGPRGYFPPEPIRWIGSMMVRNAIRRKEAAEDAGVRPNIYDSLMARFAKSAGRSDKKA